MTVAVDVAWALFGFVVLALVLDSAIRTFVLPRAASSLVTTMVFSGLGAMFRGGAGLTRSYTGRDRVMALYGPVGLLVLPAVWMVMVIGGFAALFHTAGVDGLKVPLELSGSSLLTLGFIRPPDGTVMVLAFAEAAIGLALLALLIAYIPTIYGAFSRREVAVAQLAMRAGEPPSGTELLVRAQRMGRFELLDGLWVSWQQWFAEVEETHRSLSVLAFFRSPAEDRSWVTAAGAVLDGASLMLSVVDRPFEPEAGFCVRSGFVSLRAVASHFGIPMPADPVSGDPISVSRDEFLEARAAMSSAGIPVRADLEQAWCDFAGWRVNYDAALLGLAGLVMAPYAPWSSDRSMRPASRMGNARARVRARARSRAGRASGPAG